MKPDNSKVICPQCCHQFGAISVDEQTARAAQEMEIERLRAERDALKADMEIVTGLLGAMRSQRDALNADAERYRWLCNSGYLDGLLNRENGSEFSTILIDRAVDIARGEVG